MSADSLAWKVRGTLSLVNRHRPAIAAAAASIVGTSAAIPLAIPWGPLPVMAAILFGIWQAEDRRGRWTWGASSLVIFGMVLAGAIDAPLAAGMAAAGLLASRPGLAPLGLAFLLVQTSVAESGLALLSDRLAALGLAAAAPALIMTLCLWIARPSAAHFVAASAIGSIAMAWLGNRIASAPEMAMWLAALAPTLLAAAMAIFPMRKELKAQIAVVVVLSLVALTWFWTPPRGSSETYVLLPDAPDSYAAQFFQNYVDALSFAGIAATPSIDPDSIPEGALVLLPWLTDPLPGGNSNDARIGDLARERGWTVLFGGEHSDLGGIAARIERITGRSLLRHDLTVPPDNTDNSGPLRVADVLAWPSNAIFNRGASVSIRSILDRILLAGDGWWAEPDIGEWLWAGDYIWRPGDRAGRLTLAGAVDDGKARWIVVGDNSPLISQQLVADPRPVLRLLQIATLWPALTRDLVLLVTAVALLANTGLRVHLPLCILIIAASLGHMFSAQPSQAWADSYRGESGFDERNFNETLMREPSLLATGRWRLIREGVLKGRLDPPPGRSIIFGLVGGGLEFAGTRLSDCWRLGRLKADEGPLLMDAQACEVQGHAKVILGSRSSAAAVYVCHGDGVAVLVLDVAFLANKAPQENGRWLAKVLDELERDDVCGNGEQNNPTTRTGGLFNH